jgi:hypothetical protein
MVDLFAILVVVRRSPSLGVADFSSTWSESDARIKELFRRSIMHVPFCRFLGDACREFMHLLSTVFHDALGFYCFRDTLQEVGS